MSALRYAAEILKAQIRHWYGTCSYTISRRVYWYGGKGYILICVVDSAQGVPAGNFPSGTRRSSVIGVVLRRFPEPPVNPKAPAPQTLDRLPRT